MVIARLNKDVRDIYSFYNSSSSSIRNFWNHRFLLCAKAFNFVWKSALAGSAILEVFGDDGDRETVPKLLSLAVPAFVVSHVAFGAFWSKLGYEKELFHSLREDKKGTVKKILSGIVKGNIYNYYYQYLVGNKMFSDVYDDVSYIAVKRISGVSPSLMKGLETVSEMAYRASF